ncbi:MAG TPA: PEP-CTERM sorting domain-containing protein [Candidatus Acidoferrales bacterium]|nr:PEP-CTERM sorting domain-containing protein [Candidatus Acidoferrales bacterium]
MRKIAWIIALVLAAVLTPVSRADTTYTVNQTFNVDGQAVRGACNPQLVPHDCTATTGTITGTITTDGNTGFLSSADITGDSLVYGFGAFSAEITSGPGLDGGVSDLYASATDLFLVGNDGSFTTGKGNGFQITESVSGSALNFDLSIGDIGMIPSVTGSTFAPSGIANFATVTPEPSTAVLCFLGLALIFLFRKRLAF